MPYVAFQIHCIQFHFNFGEFHNANQITGKTLQWIFFMYMYNNAAS